MTKLPLGSSTALAVSMLLMVQGCSTLEETNPARSATEQLLISTAAERAAQRLNLKIPANTRVFVESSNFEGTDAKYATAAIRSHLLSKGVLLIDDKTKADVIVETRAGALSTDRKNTVVGIPAFELPLPLASSSISVPELALYGKDGQVGVASFAAVAYNPKTGQYVDASSPTFGYSHNTKQTFLLFFSWRTNDLVPKDQKDAF